MTNETIFVSDKIRATLSAKEKKTPTEARALTFLEEDRASVYGREIPDGRLAIWSERAILPVYLQRFVKRFAVKDMGYAGAVMVF